MQEVFITEFCFSTEVLGFDHHADAFRRDAFHDLRGDLPGHALLNLKASGEYVHQTRQLADAEYFAVRNVADVAFAEKRKHVMFAHAVKFNVADNDHIVAILVEDRAVDDRVDVLFVSAGQELKTFPDAFRSFDESFAFGILAEVKQNLPDFFFDHTTFLTFFRAGPPHTLRCLRRVRRIPCPPLFCL